MSTRGIRSETVCVIRTLPPEARPVPADVIEPTQISLDAANEQQRFAHQLRGEVVAGIRDLDRVTNYLPGARE
jgi:hypothetical protein